MCAITTCVQQESMQPTQTQNNFMMRDAEAVGAAMDPNGFIMFTMAELELYSARLVSDVHDLIVDGEQKDLVTILQQWGIDYIP